MALTGLRNTIILDRDELGDFYDELRASVACKPGHLLEDSSATQCRPHTVRGGIHSRMVAWEEGLSGGTIDTEYAIGDLVRFSRPPVGTKVQMRLKRYENVSKGDYLISNGDGCLVKAAAGFLANVVADSDATPASATIQAFSNGTVTIPANTLKVGDILRVRANVFVFDNNSTDTLTLTLKLGTTTIIATAAVDVADNDVGIIDATLVIRTIGATGTFIAYGTQGLGVPGTVTAKPWQLGSTAIDTTAALSLTVNATWSVSHADNDAILRGLVVEHVKAASTGLGNGEGGYVVGKCEEASDLSAAADDGWVKVRMQ